MIKQAKNRALLGENSISFSLTRFVFCLFFILFSSLFLQGCSTIFGIEEDGEQISQPQNRRQNSSNSEEATNPQRERISLDEFQLPNIPDSMQETEFAPLFAFELLPYIVLFSSNSDEAVDKEVLEILRQRSLLLSMQEDIPTSELTLEKRVSEDKEEALKVLQSFGYYSGEVETSINTQTFPIQISITLIPHEVYTISKANINYPDNFYEGLGTHEPINKENLATSLFDFGLEENAIAKAEYIIQAIEKIQPYFENKGYPFVKVSATKFYAIENSKTLEAEIKIEPGAYKVFGDVSIIGSEKLDLSYVEKIKTWKKGDTFDKSKLTRLEEALLGIGVFSFARAHQAEEKQKNDIENITEELDIIIDLTDTSPRSWGGGLNYDSVRGFGGELFWEHRNLLGSAEFIKISGQVWRELQEARISFIKPDILAPDHDFNAIFTFKGEETDAYDTTSANLELGFEQPISIKGIDHIWLSYAVLAEVGREETDSLLGYQDYYYFGIPLQIRHRYADSLFDPGTGYSLRVKAAPYAGKYFEQFSLVKAEVDAAIYIELIENKKLVLAARGKMGSLYPQEAHSIPASLRFYAGGGNSVRGYAYQDLGPEDIHGDPIGGASIVEGSVELRYKITDTISIVPFIDFGNVYSEAYFSYPLNLKFGMGLGLRYFTPVGPLRLDVAFPYSTEEKFETNKFQVYISIGQSF